MTSSASLLEPPSSTAAAESVSELQAAAILQFLAPAQALFRKKLVAPKTHSGLPRPYSSFQHSGIRRIRLSNPAPSLFRIY